MAEAVFQHLVDKAGLQNRFEISSAATSSWELGNPVHPGTRLALRNRNIPVSPRKHSIQIKPTDYDYFDYILVMDSDNLAAMRKSVKVQKLMNFAPPGTPRDVPDPYYTGDFDTVYAMIESACKNFLGYIREKAL
jgi:protein-tyrosine phosphatase